MSEQFKVTNPQHGLQAIGPFEVNRLTIDGYEIPRLSGALRDGVWSFTLDNRFACDVPEIYGHGVAWMIANAMAIGAEYSCFGENSEPLNQFKRRLSRLNTVADIDAMEATEQ